MAVTRESVWWRPGWNLGLGLVGRLGWRGTDLDPDHLLARARKETALDDFGDPEFLEPMRLLIREFEANANADLTGRQVFAQMTLASLKNRLRIRQALRERPQIAEQAIAAPLFILGLPRTGTTLLQSLLASLGHLRTPLRWETDLTATPPAIAKKREVKAQIRIAKVQSDFANGLSPGIPLAHAVGAELPEECNPLLMSSFRALLHTTFFRCPDYHDYIYRTNFRNAYAWHKLHLQVLSFGAPAVTWSLKAPAHLGSLAELLHAYPDARVVFMHRDPLEVIPSMCQLTLALRLLVSPDQDKGEIGREFVPYLARLLEAGYAVRDRWPADAQRFIDVRYNDLVADPARTVRSILRHFGMPEGAGLDAAVARYVAEDAQANRGRHRYSLADFELRAEEIRERFARAYETLE
jgi:hypothetical protein